MVCIQTNHGTNYTAQSVDQNSSHGTWVSIGTYNLYTGSTTVSLQGNTGEAGRVIAADVVKFEYVGSIQ